MKIKTKSKKKDPLKDVISSRVRLPKDYHWRCVNYLWQDLKQFLNDDDNQTFVRAYRNKDLKTFLETLEDWNLQSMKTSDAHLSEKRAKYQLASLLKKSLMPSNFDTYSPAIQKFYESEERCVAVNNSGLSKLVASNDDMIVNSYTYALSFISRVLGDFDQLPDIWSRHGPGATVDQQQDRTSAYFKYSDWPYTCSTLARRHAIDVISKDERWIGALVNSYRERKSIPQHHPIHMSVFWDDVLSITNYNKITTVPKTAMIDRTIAIEPTLNVYLQLGIDGHIRSRLKRWDIDLDSQAKNIELARMGSITGKYATLDLKAASDTVSLKICERMLPPLWYNLLLDLRCPYGKLGGKEIFYNKISSMGNGYTFALESLIFGALVYGAYREHFGNFDPKRVAIYGDDIIVPVEIVGLVIRLLKGAGFSLNHNKSFIFGPVKESCGADWFNGALVRPVFLTDIPTSISGIICDLNRLKRMLELYFFIEIEETHIGRFLLRYIPKIVQEKLRGPYSDIEFDTYLHSKQHGEYKHSLFWYQRIVRTPVEIRGCTDLLFRKLMHPLRFRPGHEILEKSKLGSVFTPGRRNASRVSYKTSASGTWKSEYTAMVYPKIVSF